MSKCIIWLVSWLRWSPYLRSCKPRPPRLSSIWAHHAEQHLYITCMYIGTLNLPLLIRVLVKTSNTSTYCRRVTVSLAAVIRFLVLITCSFNMAIMLILHNLPFSFYFHIGVLVSKTDPGARKETDTECFDMFILVTHSFLSCNFMLHLLSADIIQSRLVSPHHCSCIAIHIWTYFHPFYGKILSMEAQHATLSPYPRKGHSGDCIVTG